MILDFGKHEGEDTEDIPIGYLQWIVDTLDNKPDLVEEAAAELLYRKKWGRQP